jgi:hypothetical protein
MTPEEFISALDAWSATGGKFRDSVPDDHKVTTPAEAEAVCRGLDSPHIYEVNSIGRPALSELVHFFQTVSTRSAGQVLATEGLVRLRRILGNALDRPFEPDLQEYKYREPYDSCAFILKVLAMYGTRGDGSLILKGARDLRVAEQGLWSVILYYLEKEHPEATDVFEALREPLPEAWAGLCYLDGLTALQRSSRCRNTRSTRGLASLDWQNISPIRNPRAGSRRHAQWPRFRS